MKLFVSAISASCVAILLAAAPSAHAVSISGSVWEGQSGSVPTTAPTSTPAATFTATSINFCVEWSGCSPSSSSTNPASGTYTIGGFLTSQGNASGVGPVTYNGSASGTDSLDNTLFEFTGTAYFTNGQSFTVNHDDGTVMYVDGSLVLSQPNPTAPSTNTYTYTGPTGTESFDFLYGEVKGPPAVYETNLGSTVTPEPSSIALLGSGLLAGAGFIRRRIQA